MLDDLKVKPGDQFKFGDDLFDVKLKKVVPRSDDDHICGGCHFHGTKCWMLDLPDCDDLPDPLETMIFVKVTE